MRPLPRLALVCLAVWITATSPAVAEDRWTAAQLGNLVGWIDRAAGEGIALPNGVSAQLRASIDAKEPGRRAELADDAAMHLLRAWRGRCCAPRRAAWWHIDGAMSDAELRAGLERALHEDRLDLYLRTIRPRYAQYDALVAALAREGDAARRALIARNLARWRWMPAQPGKRFLLVNIASQQLELWQDNKVVERWRVIIGKPVTRTPVFTTQVSGVVLNPWWNIPSSIAAEGIASFVRRNPATARAKGYIYQNGRYRQMPGENNALGRMKLVMPNPYRVFLHDTSNRALFAEDRRAFSHGCIRVDRALSFAATLLAGDGWTPADVHDMVESGLTQTVVLSATIPLYVTYFTAEARPDGALQMHEDIYRRDPVDRSAELSTGIYGSPPSAMQDNDGLIEGEPSCLI